MLVGEPWQEPCVAPSEQCLQSVIAMADAAPPQPGSQLLRVCAVLSIGMVVVLVLWLLGYFRALFARPSIASGKAQAKKAKIKAKKKAKKANAKKDEGAQAEEAKDEVAKAEEATNEWKLFMGKAKGDKAKANKAKGDKAKDEEAKAKDEEEFWGLLERARRGETEAVLRPWTRSRGWRRGLGRGTAERCSSRPAGATASSSPAACWTEEPTCTRAQTTGTR